MDPISHTQADWLEDKTQGVVAGTVRDDEHKGGECESSLLAITHTPPWECWSGGWALDLCLISTWILFLRNHQKQHPLSRI